MLSPLPPISVPDSVLSLDALTGLRSVSWSRHGGSGRFEQTHTQEVEHNTTGMESNKTFECLYKGYSIVTTQDTFFQNI
jgi:hypothetical protein